MLAASLVALLVLGAAGAAAQDRRDPAVLTLAADLRAGAGARSRVVATLLAGTPVVVLQMHGDQARVEAGAHRGWLAAVLLSVFESEARER